MAKGIASHAVVPVEAILLALALFVACARLIPRFVFRQHTTASDKFLLASVLNAIALFATDCMTYAWGGMSDDMGDDMSGPEPSEAQQISLKKVQFAGNYFYDTGIYLPKLAILALYFKLFPSTMPWLRRSLFAVSIFTVAAMLVTCFLDTFWCGRQVSVNWSLDPDACSTFNSKMVFRIDWGSNILSDIMICILPFPLLYQLQLNIKEVWGLVATFSLGAITISVSVARYATIEFIQAWTNVFVLSMAEMATAIMVVSIPSMRSTLRRGGILGVFRSGKMNSSSGSRSALESGSHAAGSSHFKVFTSRPRNYPDTHVDDDSGSEVELNSMSRKDAIYKTRRVSVHFNDAGVHI